MGRPRSTGRAVRRAGARLFVALMLAAAAGCATYDPYEDDRYSDLPWNEQQPWEGSISVPGMTPPGR